jgi:hypothetical protein
MPSPIRDAGRGGHMLLRQHVDNGHATARSKSAAQIGPHGVGFLQVMIDEPKQYRVAASRRQPRVETIPAAKRRSV